MRLEQVWRSEEEVTDVQANLIYHYGEATPNAIVVWPFYEAPLILRELSLHDGDEDWLALVPPDLADKYIPFLECEHFGSCKASKHVFRDGWVVWIAAHA